MSRTNAKIPVTSLCGAESAGGVGSKRVQPAPIDVNLDPGVRVALANRVEAPETVVSAADEAGDVAGRHAERPQHDRHRGRVELAVAAPRLEQEVVERVFSGAGG